MSTDHHWITTRIAAARTGHPLVTEEVSSRMVEVMNGKLGAQQLSQVDLTSLASALIVDMVPAPPKMDAKQ